MTTFVIPAAGLGSRMKEIDSSTPKPLIRVAGIPMLDLVIRNMQPSDKDLVIVVGRRGLGLSEWSPSKQLHGSFSYLYQELDNLTEGPALTVLSVLPRIRDNEPVIVANSDQYVLGGILKFSRKLATMKNSGLILTMWASGTRWSYVQTLGRAVVRVAEKEEISSEATVGIYGWTSREILETALSKGLEGKFRVNGEFYIAPTYNALISSGVHVEALNCGTLSRHLVGLGTPEDFYAAVDNQIFLDELNKI
jgi:NDP-sugar pyrophosphorylase family protein